MLKKLLCFTTSYIPYISYIYLDVDIYFPRKLNSNPSSVLQQGPALAQILWLVDQNTERSKGSSKVMRDSVAQLGLKPRTL